MQPFIKRRAVVNVAEGRKRVMGQMKGYAVCSQILLNGFCLPPYLQKCSFVPPGA